MHTHGKRILRYQKEIYSEKFSPTPDPHLLHNCQSLGHPSKENLYIFLYYINGIVVCSLFCFLLQNYINSCIEFCYIEVSFLTSPNNNIQIASKFAITNNATIKSIAYLILHTCASVFVDAFLDVELDFDCNRYCLTCFHSIALIQLYAHQLFMRVPIPMHSPQSEFLVIYCRITNYCRT